jgi:hypothetical protein
MDFCVSKLILMETNMSKEVGEHLFTIAYLGLLTISMCR